MKRYKKKRQTPPIKSFLKNLSIFKFYIKVGNQSRKIHIPILDDLISFGAFKGESYKICHPSQQSLLSGYHSQHSFYDIKKSIGLLKLASRFLSGVKSQKNTKFIIVGNPVGQEEHCSFFLNQSKLKFFPSDGWQPGFFSRRSNRDNVILIVYKPSLNSIAVNEAINACIPIVGFASPTCDISALDYPLVLNLEESGVWFSRFIIGF